MAGVVDVGLVRWLVRRRGFVPLVRGGDGLVVCVPFWGGGRLMVRVGGWSAVGCLAFMILIHRSCSPRAVLARSYHSPGVGSMKAPFAGAGDKPNGGL